jgi:hypothetical protein
MMPDCTPDMLSLSLSLSVLDTRQSVAFLSHPPHTGQDRTGLYYTVHTTHHDQLK